jgi:hypothetical protein
MIVYHQRNVGGFAGAHVAYWLPNQLIERRVSITSAAPTNVLVSQARSNQRFVFGRVFGRVN